MAETVAQQLARLQAEVQNLRAQQQMRPSVTKDMSLLSLIPQWTGTDKRAPLTQFFEVTEIAARIGCWSEADMVQLAIFRLSDITRAFYDETCVLHGRNITWANFKAIFPKCFRDVKTDQYRFT